MAIEATACDPIASLPTMPPPQAIDPRLGAADRRALRIRLNDATSCERFVEAWSERLLRLAGAGVAGFRLLGAAHLPVGALARLTARVRERAACGLLVWTPGMERERQRALAASRPDAVFASTGWWDGRASWYVEEHAALRAAGTVIGVVAPPIGESGSERGVTAGTEGAGLRQRAARHRRLLETAAATSSGLFVPMGFEYLCRRADDPFDADAEPALAAEMRAANERVGTLRGLDRGALLSLSGPAAAATALVRLDAADPRRARKAVALLINPDGERSVPAPPPTGPAAGIALAAPSGDGQATRLAPDEVRLVPLDVAPPIVPRRRSDPRAVRRAASEPRVVIDRVMPSVDGGRFAAKRIVDRPVTVEADIFADGHELLRAELLWRPVDETGWRRAPMAPVANDRWRAAFTPDRIGPWQFTVEAWIDGYGSLCHAIETKHRAGVDLASDLAEARALIAHLAARNVDGTRAALARVEDAFAGGDTARTIAALTAPRTLEAVDAAADRAFLHRHEPLPLEVERPQAGFASWYELFPRSITDDPARHGTFADVAGALPRIAAMGFDVLYFPPIHPIGETNRKGRNNALRAAPGDVGSPYATGSADGGHTAIHPALGTLDDFRRLRDAAFEHGLELALDFAIQCSPDHPWLKQHPEWFRRRADGTIKFAENPPKKYEDIVNVDFYGDGAVPALWEELRDTVLFWAGEGIRLFRVDNPHTKPLPFWRWMIAEVRARHPDAVFLSEAFTRPKMMYRLAKVGFSQSYTYFTWRNGKRELADYLTELTQTEVAEFFRPHFFVNTPDINPFYLQTSGRAGFLVRAALAATLSGLWGMYSGFEICEAAPLPGREEYLDSEKYEIRVRDFAAPGNIVAEIAALNRIRRANPALHGHLGLTFYDADNEQVLVYGKALPSHEDVILVAVNLDPHRAQEAVFEIPLWEWRLPDSGTLQVEDLMDGRRFAWTGKHQRVRLDPAGLPFAIWRLTAPAGAA
ncbi:MAG: alpha-1,4-glucan--maltose-1-phosphate maltosyltransferase [Enhydrobacter sp.]|nr:MAG: alpha-1,4-glucan--maltose-1-phosphate maltosyltransferase [Enhydrobacter sp.]